MPKYGEIRRLSPATYVKDCREPIREYLRSLGNQRSVIGPIVVWVKYGKGPHKSGRAKPWPIAVGPTEESVKDA